MKINSKYFSLSVKFSIKWGFFPNHIRGTKIEKGRFILRLLIGKIISLIQLPQLTSLIIVTVISQFCFVCGPCKILKRFTILNPQTGRPV